MERQTRKNKPSNADLLVAYEKKGANISATCKSLGIDRQTFYNRRKKSKELDQALKHIEESLVDFAESKLMQAITESNLTAIIFYLKTKGRHRGYVEKTEVEASVNPVYELMQQASRQEE